MSEGQSKYDFWLRQSSDSNATRDILSNSGSPPPPSPPPPPVPAPVIKEDVVEDEEEGYDSNDDFYAEEEMDASDRVEEQDLKRDERELLSEETLLGPRFRIDQGKHEKEGKSYCRPVLSAEEIAGMESLTFQHTETDYVVEDGVPVIRLWGLLATGQTVVVRDAHFRPYFYVDAPPRGNPIQPVVDRLSVFMREKERKHKGKFVLSSEAKQARSIYGYDRYGERLFYKLTMALPRHVATARNCLEDGNRQVVEQLMSTFEANVPFELRYMIDRKIHGCQWITIAKEHYVQTTQCNSRCALEVSLLPRAVVTAIPVEERGDIAPMRMLSFDIEVCNVHESGFPKAEESPVIMICAALTDTTGIIHRAAFAVRHGETGLYDPLDASDADATYVYDTEIQALLGFRAYLLRTDPDALTGWNIANFDVPYLVERAKQLGILDLFMDFSRIHGNKASIRTEEKQSKAFGTQIVNDLRCAGRFLADGIDYMKRCVFKKYRSYSLNAIAESVLKDRKLDVHHTQIPQLFRSHRNQDRTRLLYYCMKDTILPLQILSNQMAIINLVEQARVTGVPIKWLLTRGQGIKTFSNMIRYARQSLLIPSRSPRRFGSRITAGGHVEEPRAGLYLTPTISLDFGSLYPSIMQAYNICYSTKVKRSWALANLSPDDYWSPYPSVDAVTTTKKPAASTEIEEVEVEEEEQQDELKNMLERFVTGKVRPIASVVLPGPEKKRTKRERERDALESTVAGKPTDFVFVKRHIAVGVLPAMLDKLIATRQAVKDLMKPLDPKSNLWQVLNSRQNGIKLACNSVYGFLKAFTLVDGDLMAAVTSYGRNMLSIVKQTIANEFSAVPVLDWANMATTGLDPEDYVVQHVAPYPAELCRPAKFEVIYGDSVTAETPILIRRAGSLIDYLRIEELPIIGEWQVQQQDGKQYATPVPDLEVWSDTGFTRVERIIRHATNKHIFRVCTGSGSVRVTSDHSLLRPNGSMVKPIELAVGDALLHTAYPAAAADPADANFPTCFYAMGLFYGTTNVCVTQNSWAIRHPDFELLDDACLELGVQFPDVFFSMTMGEHNAVLYASDPSFIQQWNQLFYRSGSKEKHIPLAVLNGSPTQIDLFLRGYADAHAIGNVKSDIELASIQFLRGVGGDVIDSAIRSIEDLGPCPQGNYVYDLQTGNHHFAAGVGRLVVHNTDSVMVNGGAITLTEIIHIGQAMAKICTARFVKPNQLNFEAIKLHGLWLKKKRYSAVEIEKLILGERMKDAIARGKDSVKGLEGTRRDNAPIGSETQNAILRKIVRDGKVDEALEDVKRIISDLLQNQVDMSKLVVTKGLTKSDAQYKKGGTDPIHLQLKHKIRARSGRTGEVVPDTGDRVPYVVLAPLAKTGKHKTKTSELGEDPLYALTNGLPIDLDYYLYKQIWPAVIRVFTAVFEPIRSASLKSTMGRKARESLKAHQLLFDPSLPHMTKKIVPKVAGTAFGIAAFTVARPRCLGCGNALSDRDAIEPGVHSEICRHCSGREVRVQYEERHAQLKKAHVDAWDICYKCQGGAFIDVTCANKTCSNFFHRDRTTIDLEDLCKDLKRLYPARGKAIILMGLAARRATVIPSDVLRVIAAMVAFSVVKRSRQVKRNKKA